MRTCAGTPGHCWQPHLHNGGHVLLVEGPAWLRGWRRRHEPEPGVRQAHQRAAGPACRWTSVQLAASRHGKAHLAEASEKKLALIWSGVRPVMSVEEKAMYWRGPPTLSAK